ncbi:GON-4-like protein isoform X2 [Hyperolius riggenbachi]|uniref:GON-4-like protein isoform X2 n=1 Tax=Hyperolius riggenbachi TaxID=752182 RepID=UPI0035A396D0
MEKVSGKGAQGIISDETQMSSHSLFRSTDPIMAQKAAKSDSTTVLPKVVGDETKQISHRVTNTGKHVLVAPVPTPPRSEPPVQRTSKTVLACVRGAAVADQSGPRTGPTVCMQRASRPEPPPLVHNETLAGAEPSDHKRQPPANQHSHNTQTVQSSVGGGTSGHSNQKTFGRAGSSPEQKHHMPTVITSNISQSRVLNPLCLKVDLSQSKPPIQSLQITTATSPPRADTNSQSYPCHSTPKAENHEQRPPYRSASRTNASQTPLLSQSAPRTEACQSIPPSQSAPRTDANQSTSTSQSVPRTDTSHLRSNTTSPDSSNVRSHFKSQKTERKHLKPQAKSSAHQCKVQNQSESGLAQPEGVCESEDGRRLAVGSGGAQVYSKITQPDSELPAVQKHDKNTDKVDDRQPPGNSGKPKVSTCEEDEREDDSELYITLDEPHSDDKRKKKLPGKKKKENKIDADEASVSCDLDQELDRALEDGAKQHNLTVVNVRNILHEVITNEHVVAMMKAAITETEGLPPFEPKMTRSKLKEVVEKGVVIPTWNLSPIKKSSKLQAPQFVDIQLEEEDSSDEEYRPEEEEEDETAEESLLESDVESTASSPRGHKRPRLQYVAEIQEEETAQSAFPSGTESIPMGPPPPPPKTKHIYDVTFIETLNAVDEELDRSSASMDSFQSLDESLIAFRTRSKRPLKNVPIGRLEAELKAPDITPDMYDHNTAEDEDWKKWLCSLMQDDVGNEDLDDDDDDPEYNILEDWDEPDTEDMRNDRAVRITKKEVNELMEELFETFQDEVVLSQVEDEGPDEDDSNAAPDFNTPQAMRFEEPLANLLTEQHRTVKAQLEYLRMRKSMVKTDGEKSPPPEPELPKPTAAPKPPPVMTMDAAVRKRLQQQMQAHVQLLTQLHLLTFRTPWLSMEAETARLFLVELSSFAESSAVSNSHCPNFQSAFQSCNLKVALQLIPMVHSQVPEDPEPPKPAIKTVTEVTGLPKHIAWVMATRPVFIYPELLPVCAMRAPTPRDRVFFSKAEDNLLALGLKHFEGTEYCKQLISKYLLTAKTAQQLTVRMKNLTIGKAPDNIIKYYKKTKTLPPLSRFCEDVAPQDVRPPVEREKHRLPYWIKANLSTIESYVEKDAKSPDSKYPLILPPSITLTLKPLPRRFYRKSWCQKRPSVLKPLLIRPNPSTICVPKPLAKPPGPQTLPIGIISQVPPLMQPTVPIQSIVNLQQVGVPVARKPSDFCIPVSSNKRPLHMAPNPTSAPVAHIPVTQAKVMIPASSNPRFRKPLLGGIPKRKTVLRPTAMKASPLVHSAPILFAVPNGALNLVNLGAQCSVLQPVSGGGVPLTTVLLNSPHMPLSQTLIPPPIKQTFIPVTTEVSTSHCFSQSEAGESVSMTEEDELDFITVQVKEEDSPVCSRVGSPDWAFKQENAGEQCQGENAAGSEYKSVKTEMVTIKEESDDEIICVTVQVKEEEKPPCACQWNPNVEIKQEDTGEQSPPEQKPLQEPNQVSHQGNVSTANERTVIQLPSVDAAGSETSMDNPCSNAAGGAPERGEQLVEESQPQNTSDPDPMDVEDAEDNPEDSNADGNELQNQENTGMADSSTNGDMSSPTVAQQDLASPPDGQEASNDKDGPEEEEEEDFDDLTQDEDEMSSASEESVLSVPELQETMEKLTWLASERRLSQEGDSEENSQEENTEEEEEEDAAEGAAHKPEGMTDETGEESEKLEDPHHRVPSPAPVETSATPAGERRRSGAKSQSSHRVRNRRGRTRASKDASKLLLLYDEKILQKDPLREQKDMAYAQSYLTRVREALQSVPGTYEQFLNIIYEFESSRDKKSAVELYDRLRHLLQDWPQLLKDFAAFLLPEQALECGLFEEQQAFDKSRRFLRQLEICFLENPAHHQKIIKLLQSCAECPLQEIGKLKTQMWQLLRGHHHLQEEFSLFFDQLRPPASRMEDFEVMNWTEDKEYKFDGFEEVTLPEVDEEEEQSKVTLSQRSKRRKEASAGQEKDLDWLDGGKDCPCSCHDGGSEQRLKRCKRRLCSHCSSKSCESRAQRSAEAAGSQTAFRHGSAGDGRYPLSRSTIEDRTSASSAQRSRTALHTRGLCGIDSAIASKQRAQSKESTRCALRGARRLQTIKDLSLPLTEKESDHLPRSPSSPTTPSITENPDAPIEGSTQPHTPAVAIPQCDQDEESSTLQGSEREEQLLRAKNIKVSSSGEKVVLWTREADRVILTMCQESGAQDKTFADISAQLGNKSPSEVAQRFRELVTLFQTGCVTSSDEEEDEGAGITEENMSDPEPVLSEEED